MLSKRLANLEESATLALNAQVKALAASGQTVYNLTAGEPDQDTPHYIQKAVSKTLDQNKYTPTSGIPALKAAIATSAQDFYKANWIKEENIIVTAGAKPALFASFQALLNDGDEVIIPSPSWVSYKHQIELSGGKVATVPLKPDFDLDATKVIIAITKKTKIILINSPNNPTGSVYSSHELTKLAKAIKNKSIFVLSDDIYAKLVYGIAYMPITSFGFNKERLIIINGFSKSQALTGWRIGYLIAPANIASAITQILSHTLGNAPLPSQHAALSALERNDVPPMLKDLTRRHKLVSTMLKTIPNISFTQPRGAFYFFVDLRKITNNTELWCKDLLTSKKVALVPGEAFGAPGYVRLSFAASDETLKNGLQKIAEFIKETNK